MYFIKSQIKALLFFSLSFAGGLALFFSISEDLIIQRDPAAINGKVFQISQLSPSQIKQQLNNKIKIQAVIDGQKALRLEGFSSALCKTYSQVELSFEAEGIAVEGIAPSMLVKAPCEAGQDPAEMASIIIPYSMILSEKPRNAEFRFDGFSSRFEFKHSSDEWPRTWILKSVQFKSEENGNKLVQLIESGETKTNSMVILEF